MSKVVIKVEHLSKAYQLGEIGTGTISRDLERWFAKLRGKEDPYMKLGETNDRTIKGGSDVVWSLKDINFEIEKGDAVGIIGRNGAGKSTLLKIISRVTAPTSGRISGKGRVASLLEVGTGFHPELTGRENIYLNGTILGMRKREIDRKLDEIVEFSGVLRYIDTPVKRYSSGMYVRLAFAVAAHLNSEVLIVDEVLAVGDAQFQRKCLGKMQDASTNEGKTVLFVSHQLGMIQTLCKRCIHLEAGMVHAQGPTADVIKGYLETGAKVDEEDMNDIIIDSDSDKSAQIRSLRLIDEEGRSRNEFDVFEKRYLEAEVEVKTDRLSFIFYYYLKKNEEIIVCSHENDRDASRLDLRKKGLYKYRISLPVNIKAGTYSFASIGLGIPNQGAIHALENVLEFNLEEYSFDGSLSGFSNKRPGVFLSDSAYDITELVHQG
jgi:lipopolysaccharide transport system ATP-binding protein